MITIIIKLKQIENGNDILEKLDSVRQHDHDINESMQKINEIKSKIDRIIDLKGLFSDSYEGFETYETQEDLNFGIDNVEILEVSGFSDMYGGYTLNG